MHGFIYAPYHVTKGRMQQGRLLASAHQEGRSILFWLGVVDQTDLSSCSGCCSVLYLISFLAADRGVMGALRKHEK